MTNVLNKINMVTALGYRVEFYQELNFFFIRLERISIKGKINRIEQCLPLIQSENEDRICSVINYCLNYLIENEK